MRLVGVVVLLPLLLGLAQPATIIQELNFLGQFSTLLRLIEEAGLTDTLTRGLFTVFAPSDSAFSKLTTDVLFNISGDQTKIQQSVLYHITSRKNLKAALENDGLINTLQGTPLRTNFYKNGMLTVNGKLVDTADIDANNGVIHVVEEFIYPPPTSTIAEILAKDPRFSTLSSAMAGAGLTRTLSNRRPITLFAPTNDAFADMDGLEDILANRTNARGMLQRHMVSGTVFSLGINDNDTLFSLRGNTHADELDFAVKVESDGIPGTISVETDAGGAAIIQPDILATNGVIHVIDAVI